MMVGVSEVSDPHWSGSVAERLFLPLWPVPLCAPLCVEERGTGLVRVVCVPSLGVCGQALLHFALLLRG
jgi:hypothetical protein